MSLLSFLLFLLSCMDFTPNYENHAARRREAAVLHVGSFRNFVDKAEMNTAVRSFMLYCRY